MTANLLEDQKMIQHEIHDEMRNSYIDYAMIYQSRVRFRSMRESVIVVFDPAMQWAEKWK